VYNRVRVSNTRVKGLGRRELEARVVAGVVTRVRVGATAAANSC
jgi:hypothetical protein